MGQNGTLQRFRGSYPAKIDDRGRIKIPSRYLSILESQYGKEIYLTSLNGDHVLFFPLPVWESIEQRIAAIKMRDPDLEEYISRISFWGTETEIDHKGRILIPANLRESSQLVEKVLVLGKIDYLVIWNSGVFESKFISGTFSDDRQQKISRILNELSALSRHE